MPQHINKALPAWKLRNRDLFKPSMDNIIAMEFDKDKIKELREESRQERKAEETKSGRSRRARKWVYLVLAAIIIIGGGYGLVTLQTQPRPAVTGGAINSFLEGSSFAKGEANATVTIIEFSDFQCPFCRRFALETLPQIQKEYIDTGKAKLVYKNFPLVQTHQFAFKAAEAALCAGDQGKFWEMHDTLYVNSHLLDINSLKAHASNLGLDTDAFNTCLDSNAKAAIVQQDMLEGRTLGITGTPFFLINGVEVSGARPFSDFKQIIDSELTKAQ